MKNLKMFCLSTKVDRLKMIKEFNYIPVGLSNESFSEDWLQDKSGENISSKNKYYGEYTFHYWLWKNYIDKIEDKWLGFCQYRKFWSTEKKIKICNSLSLLNSLVLKEIPSEYENFEVILGDLMPINKLKTMKLLKRGMKTIIKNPSALFDKKKRNIKFHFDMWHGHDYLNRAIDVLDDEDRKDFSFFVNSKTSFNPHNMFICKSKKILKNYYEVVFPWLNRCEKLFGFENLSGYGQTRIYGFLAERFMSYWFQKNAKTKTMPIIFYQAD